MVTKTVPTQVALPIRDLISGGYSPTPVACQLRQDCEGPDDASKSSTNLCRDKFSVELSPMLCPCEDWMEVQVRLRKTVVKDVGAIITLQAGELVKKKLVCLASAFTTYSIPLTPEEVAQIKDFKAISLTVETCVGWCATDEFDDEKCCCEECCYCSWLDEQYEAGNLKDLKVTFSGALGGECVLVPNLSPPDNGCVWWENRDLLNDECLDDPCPLYVHELVFLCPGTEDCQEYEAEITINNIGCHPTPAVVTATSVTCPPDGPFEAVFTWDLVEDGPPETAGRCCGYTQITATITEL